MKSVVKGRNIFITGGTGSFGKAFIRHILPFEPNKVVVFSRDELKQWEMAEEFQDRRLRFFIGDVRDKDRLIQATKDTDLLIHAAALKQVPIAEYNPMECIKTNVFGAQNVVEACLANEIPRTIALSTDKAASPINLYGASKLASDKIFTAANSLAGSKDIFFSVVRYGNVAASRGSVVPLFLKLLADGAETIPITDREMTRFLITLPQGVDFVLKSFARMQGGEIFVPKIPSIQIMDLVSAICPGKKIEEIGIRAGEKIHELMIPEDSALYTVEFEDHFVIKPTIRFNRKTDYTTNAIGEQGKEVARHFEYASSTNPEFLTPSQIRQVLLSLGCRLPEIDDIQHAANQS